MSHCHTSFQIQQQVNCKLSRCKCACGELNLQTVRRSLIQMIEDFEAEDCPRCRLLKCLCQPPTPPESTDSLETDPRSPPATDLPHPDFIESLETKEATTGFKDIEAWVRTSTPNPEKTVSPGCKKFYINNQIKDLVNFSWPPAPKSVWNDYKKRINMPEINMGTVSQASSVQDFFNAFSVMNSPGMTQMFAQNRALMQKLKVLAGKSTENSYF